MHQLPGPSPAVRLRSCFCCMIVLLYYVTNTIVQLCQSVNTFLKKNIAPSSSSCEYLGKAAPGGCRQGLERAADQSGSPSGSPYETKEDASFLQNQHLPLVGVFDFILLQSSGLFVISECPSFHSYHMRKIYTKDTQLLHEGLR